MIVGATTVAGRTLPGSWPLTEASRRGKRRLGWQIDTVALLQASPASARVARAVLNGFSVRRGAEEAGNGRLWEDYRTMSWTSWEIVRGFDFTDVLYERKYRDRSSFTIAAENAIFG